MKKSIPQSTAEKVLRGTKPLAVQLEEAVRKADVARKKASLAKAALKKAKKVFKLARKAAKAARKEARALQDVFQEAISRADGKSAASARKSSAALRAAMESSSEDSSKLRLRPPAKRKRVRRTPAAAPSVQPVAAGPQDETVSEPTVAVDAPMPSPPLPAESEGADSLPGDH